MKDIAKHCGVSVATVSKALNNQSDISDETKQKIKNAAKELGYFPNSSARALKTKRSYNIGVLYMEESQGGFTHGYFSGILQSFRTAVEPTGYCLTFINGTKKASNMTYYEDCLYRGFDGVLIACANYKDPGVIDLIESEIPVVTIDATFDSSISVIANNKKGLKDLVNHAIHRGHTNIAFIHGQESEVTSERVKGYKEALSQRGIPIREEYIKKSHYRSYQEAYEYTIELLTLKERPTCILYPDDMACFGGINAIKSRGLYMPEDISVAGFDGYLFSQMMKPTIETVQQDSYNIGRVAGEELVKMIETPDLVEQKVFVLDGHLIPGDSVRKFKDRMVDL